MGQIILKYLQLTTNDLTVDEILLGFVASVIVAMAIFISYRFSHSAAVYSAKFNASLVMLTIVTTLIMSVIGNNIALSLGMVGALSIVRFRTAIKDPMDLMFLFWSISIGIICGAGFAEIAVILSVVVTIGIIVLQMIPVAKAPMILIVNAEKVDLDEQIIEEIKKETKYYKIKSRNMTKDKLDIVIELRTKAGGDLVKKIMGIEGVSSVALLSHNGEVTY